MNFDVTKKYNREDFLDFLSDFLPDDYETKEEELFAKYTNINSGVQLGSCESLNLDIFEFETQKNLDARVTLTREVCSVMEKHTTKPNALAIFYCNDSEKYRFSLITVDYVIENNKIKTQYSNPCRFSFRLGEDCKRHTPDQMLILKGVVKDLEDLKSRFSVETVTKEFYNELFAWYEWAIEPKTKVTFPNDTSKQEDDREKIDVKIIRLITRIMFVWFIKQKELVPNQLFNQEYLKTILKDFKPQSKTNGCFYNAILQNLFFATLNRAIIDDEGNKRAFAEKKGYRDLKTLYRYSEMFTINKNQIIELFSKVPFLNGGLFECLDKTYKYDGVEKAYNLDGFSRNDEVFTDGTPKWRANIPNILFFEDEKGLFSIFNRYNFTVEESTPSDVQVALDPELLGKVFENLLGAYNPETKESARKDSGSFYTPREIVNYMVDESLKNYLENCLPQYKDIIHTLFNNEVESLKLKAEVIESLTNALTQVKALDPACGSGAFPMGLLNRLVELLLKIKPEQNVYELKLKIIENCIYGVDVQSIAVQIAKLRFFISLICDCQKDKAKENFGIPTLPNLETKFVCANSLINSEVNKYKDDWTKSEVLTNKKIKLSETRSKHLKASNVQEKIKYRNEDEQLRKELSEEIQKSLQTPNQERIDIIKTEIERLNQEYLKFKDEFLVEEGESQSDLFGNIANDKLFTYDKNKDHREEILKQIDSYKNDIKKEQTKSIPQGFIAAIETLVTWNPYDQNAVSPFFDADWMFGIKDGFDIVIGNPPYVSTKGVSTEDKKKYEKEFGFSDDTYNLFTFKGLSLCKEAGSLNYIIPKTFWTTQTKRNMRDLILSKQINYIFDTANPFEAAMVDTCIMQVQNSNFNKTHKIKFLDGTQSLSTPKYFDAILQNTFINTQNSVIFKPTELNMRIYELYGQKVKDLYDTWWEKIKTSRDIEKNKIELENYRKNLKPGDVALLGCLTEGGQGLATANNGKYIAVRSSTKWAKNIIESRPKKLIDAIKKNKKIEKEFSSDPQEWLNSATEEQIATKFDELKEKYGRDIFGQGYIYRLVDDDKMANVDDLTEDEKANGIETNKKYYVPYDKGDKDGNRWYLETPFAIAWSRENVRFLKTDPKARYQGYTFFFREGFCWIDVNSTYLKARLKVNGVFDVLSMSLFSQTEIPDFYWVTLINSEFISLYVDNFVNNTSHFQINDARQLPVIIPNKNELNFVKTLFDNATKIKKQQLSSAISQKTADEKLDEIQKQVDAFVEELYSI